MLFKLFILLILLFLKKKINKIGDFGLATTNNAMFDPGSFRNIERIGNEDSMTGGI